MVAVILAAGKGSRLGNYTKDLPKSLLPLNKNGDTLLDYNLKMLNTFELKKIIIVTGFNSDKLRSNFVAIILANSNLEIFVEPAK